MADVYALLGNKVSDQAEASTLNPGAADIKMRCLVELQVQTILMCQAFGLDVDLAELRQSVADSIT